jgi:hypothetical protein
MLARIKYLVGELENKYLASKERFLSEKPNCSPAIRQSFKSLELLQAGICLWCASSTTCTLRRLCRFCHPAVAQPSIVVSNPEPTPAPPMESRSKPHTRGLRCLVCSMQGLHRLSALLEMSRFYSATLLAGLSIIHDSYIGLQLRSWYGLITHEKTLQSG